MRGNPGHFIIKTLPKVTLQDTLPVNQDTLFLSGTRTRQSKLETRDEAAGGTQKDSDPTCFRTLITHPVNKVCLCQWTRYVIFNSANKWEWKKKKKQQRSCYTGAPSSCHVFPPRYSAGFLGEKGNVINFMSTGPWTVTWSAYWNCNDMISNHVTLSWTE